MNYFFYTDTQVEVLSVILAKDPRDTQLVDLIGKIIFKSRKTGTIIYCKNSYLNTQGVHF